MQAQQAAAADLSQAMKMLAGQNAAGPRVEPVNFRDLKALLPETLPGFSTRRRKGRRRARWAWSCRRPTPTTAATPARTSTSKLVDVGRLAGPLALGMAELGIGRDRSRDRDRLREIHCARGNKAFEKSDSRSRRGEIKVLVGGRFIVEVKGRNVKVDDIKAAVGQLDLAKLAILK